MHRWASSPGGLGPTAKEPWKVNSADSNRFGPSRTTWKVVPHAMLILRGS